jgi:hypothetical protein
MKRLILVILLTLGLAGVADAATTARQIDFLLAGYRHPTSDAVLSGGKVKTYLTGTSTLSSLWTDRAKGGTATNPVVLDSAGKAEVYGDNIYKFEIYDSNDVLLETISGLYYSDDVAVGADLTGDVYASDETSKVLENGTDGTDSTYTGDVTGDLTGNVTGDVTGDLTGDIKADDGTVVIDPGTIVSDGYIKSGCSFADSTDTTKKVQFDISGATTSKKATIDTNHTLDRTHTLPDKTGTIAHTSDLIFSESFTSTAQTISQAGLLTIAHGLSATPYHVAVYIKNTTSEGNWSIGDETFLSTGRDSTGNNNGFAMWPDATNINIRFANTPSPIQHFDKTTGATLTVTNGSWELYVKAWN